MVIAIGRKRSSEEVLQLHLSISVYLSFIFGLIQLEMFPKSILPSGSNILKSNIFYI